MQGSNGRLGVSSTPVTHTILKMGGGDQGDHDGSDDVAGDGLRQRCYGRGDGGATIGGSNYPTWLKTTKVCSIHHL